ALGKPTKYAELGYLNVPGKGKESQEHGVKGMKWGHRKDRTSKTQKTQPTVQAPPPVVASPPQQKPSLAEDPRTLGMMGIEKWESSRHRESRAREHGGDGTIMHPLDSGEYIPMHEGGSGSGNFGHEG